jgi:hypothetical protein
MLAGRCLDREAFDKAGQKNFKLRHYHSFLLDCVPAGLIASKLASNLACGVD